MAAKNYISIDTICTHYEVTSLFIENLQDAGLIKLVEYQQVKCLPHTSLHNFERIIRLHKELQLNSEGIDVVLNLLERIELQQEEIKKLRNHLRHLDSELF